MTCCVEARLLHAEQSESVEIFSFSDVRNETEDAALSSLPGAGTSCKADRLSNKRRYQHHSPALTPPTWVPMGAWKNHRRFHKLSPYHRREDNYDPIVGLCVTIPESSPVCQWSLRRHCADRPGWTWASVSSKMPWLL